MAVVANCWYFHRSPSHQRMDFSLDERDTHVMLSSIIYFKSKIKKQPEITKKRSWWGPVPRLSSSTVVLFIRLESGSSVDVTQSSSSCSLSAGLVTDTGGNFWGTGAEEASRSPAAGLDPTPCGPRVDTGPSEAEAQLRTDKNAKVRESYRSINIHVTLLNEQHFMLLYMKGSGTDEAYKS